MTPQIEEYVNSHISREPDYLYRIDRLTNLRMINGRMCSGHIQGRLLKMLTTMAAPKECLNSAHSPDTPPSASLKGCNPVRPSTLLKWTMNWRTSSFRTYPCRQTPTRCACT